MTAFPSSCYDIIVYDWESDNTTGDVVVPLDMYWSDSEHRESCLPTTEDPLRPNTGSGMCMHLVLSHVAPIIANIT